MSSSLESQRISERYSSTSTCLLATGAAGRLRINVISVTTLTSRSLSARFSEELSKKANLKQQADADADCEDDGVQADQELALCGRRDADRGRGG